MPRQPIRRRGGERVEIGAWRGRGAGRGRGGAMRGRIVGDRRRRLELGRGQDDVRGRRHVVRDDRSGLRGGRCGLGLRNRRRSGGRFSRCRLGRHRLGRRSRRLRRSRRRRRRRLGPRGRLDSRRRRRDDGCGRRCRLDDGRGCGLRGGRRLRRRLDRCRRDERRRDRHAWRKEGERVEVALRVGGDAHAEVHVRLREVRVARGRRGRDGRTLGDGRVLRDGERAEVRQGDREPVGRRDRDALARGRNGPGERDDARGRREDGRARVGADHDPAVLARGERMRGVEEERFEHRAACGPRPGLGSGHDDERGKDRGEHETTHGETAFPPSLIVLVRDSVRCCRDSEQGFYGRGGSPLLSNEITKLSQ